MSDAESINRQLLSNNAGILSQQVPDWMANFIGAAPEIEQVAVGDPPKRNVRREMRRNYALGRRNARRTEKFLRASTGRNLAFAQRVQPQLARMVDNIPGVSDATGLLEKLNAQAHTDLDAGRRLTAGEEREAIQGARAAFAARGLANSNPAAVAEVMNRHNFGEQRYRQRQAFAQGLIGQNMARSAMYDPLTRLGIANNSRMAAGMIPGTMQLAQGIRNQDAAAQLAVTQQQASIDNQQALQQAAMQHSTDQQYNTFGFDDYMTQLNHAYAAQIAQLNANAAQSAGQMGLAGQIGGSALGAVGSIFGGAGGAAAGGGGLAAGIGAIF